MSLLLKKLQATLIGDPRSEVDEDDVNSVFSELTTATGSISDIFSGIKFENGLGSQEDEEKAEKFKALYKSFLVTETSLKKYFKTCTAFLEVTGLMVEGVDQMTADVLTFCTSVEDCGTIRSLENEALRMRDGMPQSEEIVNESIRKHLLGPMGDRLRFFRGVKERAKTQARLRREYYEQRKLVCKLRIDRNCDHAKLMMAEEKLATLENTYQSMKEELFVDLQNIFTHRAAILKEPFDALRCCQVEFMSYICDILRSDDHRNQQDEWGNNNNNNNLDPNEYNEVTYDHTLSTSGPSQRDVVAQIVKEFHSLRGHRIFERPAQYQAIDVHEEKHASPDGRIFQRPKQFESVDVSVIQHEQVPHEEQPAQVIKSTYQRVALFAREVAQTAGRNSSACAKKPESLDNKDSAARTVQRFIKVLRAQKEARQYATQIVSVNIDPDSGCPFYSNPHTGFMSWTPTLFAPLE